MGEPKITILPPQKAPKLLTVRKAISSLGEHCMAFLNTNNKKGFLVDETPEEPVEELMVMMFLTLLEHITKYELLSGIKCKKIKPSKADIAKDLTLLSSKRLDSISISPMRRHIVGTRVNFSFAIACSREAALSYTEPLPLRDSEYRSRRAQLTN